MKMRKGETAVNLSGTFIFSMARVCGWLRSSALALTVLASFRQGDWRCGSQSDCGGVDFKYDGADAGSPRCVCIRSVLS